MAALTWIEGVDPAANAGSSVDAVCVTATTDRQPMAITSPRPHRRRTSRETKIIADEAPLARVRPAGRALRNACLQKVPAKRIRALPKRYERKSRRSCYGRRGNNNDC